MYMYTYIQCALQCGIYKSMSPKDNNSFVIDEIYMYGSTFF